MIQLIASNSFLTVNKSVAQEYGLEAAALLAELASAQVYWETHNGLDDEGMFFETAEQITENTSLTTYQQSKAVKLLEDAKILNSKRKGVPARKYFKINTVELELFFQNKFSKNLKTRIEKTEEQDSQNFENINKNRTNKNRVTRIDNNDPVLNSSLSEPVKEKVADFLAYRVESKKPYKSERSIKSLVRKVEEQERLYGSIAVIKCIDMSIQNGWQGIFWDKIETGKNNNSVNRMDMVDQWVRNAEQNNTFGLFSDYQGIESGVSE